MLEDCVPCLLANMHVENIDECLCQCMLFVVGYGCGDVVCVIIQGQPETIIHGYTHPITPKNIIRATKKFI